MFVLQLLSGGLWIAYGLPIGRSPFRASKGASDGLSRPRRAMLCRRRSGRTVVLAGGGTLSSAAWAVFARACEGGRARPRRHRRVARRRARRRAVGPLGAGPARDALHRLDAPARRARRVVHGRRRDAAPARPPTRWRAARICSAAPSSGGTRRAPPLLRCGAAPVRPRDARRPQGRRARDEGAVVAVEDDAIAQGRTAAACALKEIRNRAHTT